MTVKDLSQLFYLNREIEMLKNKLADKEDSVAASSPSLSGMPRSNNSSSKVEREALEIVEIRNLLDSRLKKAETEKLRLEQYINRIPDTITRQVFTYRFINGLPWEQVADCIGAKDCESVKKRCYRYLKKENAKNEEKKFIFF